MKPVQTILDTIKLCIEENSYIPLETDKLELKDLSGGSDWTELYKSVCAFLNGQGGIVIVGINEDTKRRSYHITGYDPSNEEKLKGLPRLFTTDGKTPVDLSEFIRPDLFEVIDFMGRKLCVLYIEKLPEDRKFVLFKGIGYVRKLTGDHRLSPFEIDAQKELRTELELARELRTVDGDPVKMLDVDKLNEYIHKLNAAGLKVETLKADVTSSMSFLEWKKFVLHQKPTLLGMLVCGNELADHIGSRCQVDCFVDVGGYERIADNKKILKDNIIPLLSSSVGFVFANIGTGISNEKGGSKTFEYPERLIRETVNNALAHRDYSVDRFISITIKPGVDIEIRNPGRFRHEQLQRVVHEIPLRRIIPIPKPQNPRLADILKSFDRWEGKGWGMSSLTNMALDNLIDVAYYVLHNEDDIGLFIPRGKVLDDEAKWWLKSFDGMINRHTNGRGLNEEQQTAMAYFYKSERLNRLERYTIALTPDNNHFAVIEDLLKWKLIERHPKSTDFHPTYVVARTLTKKDFFDDLRAIFGGAFDNLGNHFKDTLNAIYHLNKFGRDPNLVNAAQVGDFIYFGRHKTVVDVEAYNSYKRKIRKVVNQLTERGFLIKSNDARPSYWVNEGFERKPSLFDQ